MFFVSCTSSFGPKVESDNVFILKELDYFGTIIIKQRKSHDMMK